MFEQFATVHDIDPRNPGLIMGGIVSAKRPDLQIRAARSDNSFNLICPSESLNYASELWNQLTVSLDFRALDAAFQGDLSGVDVGEGEGTLPMGKFLLEVDNTPCVLRDLNVGIWFRLGAFANQRALEIAQRTEDYATVRRIKMGPNEKSVLSLLLGMSDPASRITDLSPFVIASLLRRTYYHQVTGDPRGSWSERAQDWVADRLI